MGWPRINRFLFVIPLISVLIFSGGCWRHLGVYHTVKPGQTIWRIAKTYNVDLQELAEINNIEDPSQVKAGDQVFIPDARKVLEVEVVRPTTLTKVVIVPSSTEAPIQTKAKPSNLTQKKPAVEKNDKVVKPSRPSSIKSKSVKTSKKGNTKKKKEVPPQKVLAMKTKTSSYKGDKEIIIDRGKFIWPSQGVLSSKFGIRNGRRHDGIDISNRGGTKVVAARAGKVVYSDNKLRGYGNLVIIKHEDDFMTVYAHNRRNMVQVGQFVRQGENIAEMGSTGRSSAPHLHFEVRKAKKARNPLFYLPNR